MILKEVISSIDTLDGIILFTVFMLPASVRARRDIYEAVLNSGRTLHAALEDIRITNYDDIQMVEDILRLNTIALTDESAETLRDFCINHNVEGLSS